MNVQYCIYWLIAVARIVILAIGVTGAVGFGFGAISDGVAVAIYRCIITLLYFFYLIRCLFVFLLDCLFNCLIAWLIA